MEAIMGDVVDLHSQPPRPEDNLELVVDLGRSKETIVTEQQVRKRHHLLGEDAWKAFASDDRLVEAVEEEHLRRIRSGAAKRELAQKHIVRGPLVASAIMDNPAASDKHRLDAIKTLDGLTGGPQSAPAADRLETRTAVGTDDSGAEIVEHYNKSIAIDANDVDPNDSTPQGVVAAITKKDDDDGQGYL